jgi:DNA (cytosine-5)-methyltransferase 1
MARLQSFPDTFIFEGSMKKAMWQIGNAVPPRLAECIGYALIPYLTKIALDMHGELAVNHHSQTQLAFD